MHCMLRRRTVPVSRIVEVTRHHMCERSSITSISRGVLGFGGVTG